MVEFNPNNLKTASVQQAPLHLAQISIFDTKTNKSVKYGISEGLPNEVVYTILPDDFNIFSVIGDDKLNAEKQLIKDQIDTDLRYLVEELPDDQKEVLLMRIYKDMSFKEISENTGVSINTALGRMRYALINLRKIIEKNNIALTN